MMTNIQLPLGIQVLILVLAIVGPLSAEPAKTEAATDSQSLSSDFRGEWKGNGIVYGNEVTLSRIWKTDLAGKFLTADMSVMMANGRSFRALLWIKETKARELELVWMDESGNLERHQGLRTVDGRSFSFQYLDAGSNDTEPGWRRATYRITSLDTYEEEVHIDKDGKWERVANFIFKRKTK